MGFLDVVHGYGDNCELVGNLLYKLVSLSDDGTQAAYLIAVTNEEYFRAFAVGVCNYECSNPVILFGF